MRVRLRDYVKLVLSTPLYQSLMAYAAIRAVALYIRGDFSWEKSTHQGAHLTLPRQSNPSSEVAA